MESLFIQLSYDAYISINKKLTLKTGFVVQDHINVLSIAVQALSICVTLKPGGIVKVAHVQTKAA